MCTFRSWQNMHKYMCAFEECQNMIEMTTEYVNR